MWAVNYSELVLLVWCIDTRWIVWLRKKGRIAIWLVQNYATKKCIGWFQNVTWWCVKIKANDEIVKWTNQNYKFSKKGVMSIFISEYEIFWLDIMTKKLKRCEFVIIKNLIGLFDDSYFWQSIKWWHFFLNNLSDSSWRNFQPIKI